MIGFLRPAFFFFFGAFRCDFPELLLMS